MDIRDTIQPNSQQINAEDLIGGERTVTVTAVEKGTAEQPVFIHTAEFEGRTFRPAKSVRRLLVAAWGAEASAYVGRRMTLFNDPTVKWAGQQVGGVRVSAMSHLDGPLTVNLTVTRGKRAPFTVQPLPDAPDPLEAIRNARDMDELRAAWEQAKNVPGATEAKDIRKQELA